MRGIALLLLGWLLMFGSPLAAQSLEDRVVANLEQDCYVRIVRTRTLLGRVRIVALREGHIREVVINPRTNEILRDVEIRSDNVPEIPPSGAPRCGGDDGS